MVRVIVTVDAGGVEQRLDTLTRAVTSPEPIWDALADEFVAGEREVFARGASDKPWPALTPRYARWKAKHHPGPLMVRTGRLRDSVTRRPLGVEQLTGTTATLGTDVPYARFNPNRRVVWMTKTRQAAWIDKAQRILQQAATR